MEITLYLFPLVSTNSREYKRQSKTEIKGSLYLLLYGIHQKAPFQSNIVILFLNKTLLLNRNNKNLLQCVQELSISVTGWMIY
jgi:hypothetical protein